MLGLEFHERGRPWLLTVGAGVAMSVGQSRLDLLLEASYDVLRRVVVVGALKLLEQGGERRVIARRLVWAVALLPRLALAFADDEFEVGDA